MLNHTCPECRAVFKEDLSCQSIFDQFLVLEFTDPGYGEVHFLTVACYMIQHGRYSNEALAWIQQKLSDYLEKGLTAGQIRTQAVAETGPQARNWKVTRQAEDPPQRKIDWSMTIADVASKYQDAASYCKLVTQWARTTLQEMKPLIPQS